MPKNLNNLKKDELIALIEGRDTEDLKEQHNHALCTMSEQAEEITELRDRAHRAELDLQRSLGYIDRVKDQERQHYEVVERVGIHESVGSISDRREREEKRVDSIEPYGPQLLGALPTISITNVVHTDDFYAGRGRNR